jgi:nicotinamide mononucleotide transporter
MIVLRYSERMLSPAFTFFGVAVTHLEVVAFLLSLACVYCNIHLWIVAWPLTIAASALYAWLFFASKLYGDGALQFLFIVMGLWGWWQWAFARQGTTQSKLAVSRLGALYWPWLLVIWLVLWMSIGAFLRKFTDTDVPWWDAFPTAGSVIGTWLLARKHIENWPVWLLVNAVAVTLFAYKSLYLTSILYAIFFAMAIWGWRQWRVALNSRAK